MDRREAGPTSAGASDAVLHHKMLARERKRIEAEFAAEARSHARVEINSQAVAAMRLEASPQVARTEAPDHPPGVP